ncbi:MAG: EF-Tu/IF-2/RF-3 family GTPase [Candidatus Odinarchaeia archaeon]
MVEEEIGTVMNYFSKINVAAIQITRGSVKVGDTIRIKGATTDLTQKVDSIEINKQKINEAKEGDAIGIKVIDRVRPGDKVYKVS